jgi:excisionase family DNA binding protein
MERVEGEKCVARRKRLNYAKGAKYLGIAEGTLRNWVSSGDYLVPYIRVGRLIRFDPDALDAWIASRGRNQIAASPPEATVMDTR